MPVLILVTPYLDVELSSIRLYDYFSIRVGRYGKYLGTATEK
jgi:hypothetical protein